MGKFSAACKTGRFSCLVEGSNRFFTKFSGVDNSVCFKQILRWTHNLFKLYLKTWSGKWCQVHDKSLHVPTAILLHLDWFLDVPTAISLQLDWYDYLVLHDMKSCFSHHPKWYSRDDYQHIFQLQNLSIQIFVFGEISSKYISVTKHVDKQGTLGPLYTFPMQGLLASLPLIIL